MNIVPGMTVVQKPMIMVLVDEPTLAETEQWLSACEHCAGHAAIAFVYLLDALMECEEPALTEYVLSRPARCPRCFSDVSETTLVSLGTA